MKILLVNPLYQNMNIAPSYFGFKTYMRADYPPVGLSYIASVLENKGYNVKIIDSFIQSYTLSDIKKEIISFDPDVIGISATTQVIYEANAIVKIAKEINPNCLTIIGGPHVTYMSDHTLNENPYLDIVLRGEGEQTIIEILESKREKWNEITGISYKYNNKIFENPNRDYIQNLDTIPFPAYHLLPLKKYKIYGHLRDDWISGKSFCGIFTARGCPFKCAFCAASILGVKCRLRSPQNIIEELRILRDKYYKKEIEFLDSTFTINKERTEEICRLIRQEKIDISWFCSTRVDRFNKKIAKTLVNSGCHTVLFGIESGVQHTLDFLNKNFLLDDATKAVKIAKEEGLQTIASFIIGSPYETKKMINQTIKYAKKINPTAAIFHPLTPFPGTQIYKIAKEKNLILTEDLSNYNFVSSCILKNENISKKELLSLLKKAYIEFYLKPSHICVTLKEIFNVNIKKFIKKPNKDV